MKDLKVLEIARHRNGVCGAPFHVVRFEDAGEESGAFVATVFEAADHCAVLHVGRLAGGTVEFGVNSWRGDRFEPALRRVIAEWEKALTARLEEPNPVG